MRWQSEITTPVMMLLVVVVSPALCLAGMPAPLPGWTQETYPYGTPSDTAAAEWLLQGVSFFAVCFLISAWGIKKLWNALRSDIPTIPSIGYGRALSFTILWGLLFVIVLTMISGARELITPGAWQKQVWTYSLQSSSDRTAPDSQRTGSRAALRELRFTLWNYAAQHEGRFPPAESELVSSKVRSIPDWPGLQFLYVPEQVVAPAGRLLIFEPDLNGNERLVLLTNGVIGTMSTVEIQEALNQAQQQEPER